MAGVDNGVLEIAEEYTSGRLNATRGHSGILEIHEVYTKMRLLLISGRLVVVGVDNGILEIGDE